jgi:ABC-type uncharacterized transport system fused permease/ATPase subunit
MESVDRRDLVWWASGILAVLICVVSLHWLYSAPFGSSFNKDILTAYKELYEAVVGTLLKLFAIVVSLKTGYLVARYWLEKHFAR